MFQTMLEKVVHAFSLIPFSGPTWFVLFILSFFILLFVRAHLNPNSRVNWEDLIVDSKSNKVTPYKVGYLVGVIVSTWIVIDYADDRKLTFDIFGLYLSYLLGGAGWMAMVSKKGGTNADPIVDPEPETKKGFAPPPEPK